MVADVPPDPQVAAWVKVQQELSRLLYEHDPEGMGSSVGAPTDEYDDGATELIRQIKRPEVGSPDVAVRQLWPGATDDLVAAVREVWERFRRAPSLTTGPEHHAAEDEGKLS